MYCPPDFPRRLVSEGTGTALLVAAVVGSGIAGERLSGGNVAIALLANAVATGGALIALILTFQSISGAHFNPAVSLTSALRGSLAWREVPGTLLVQFLGGIAGVLLAHGMFGMPAFSLYPHERAGLPQLGSEMIATFGLLSVILGCARSTPGAVPYAVGAYITSAYWFTSSTSFANPAVTVARCLTNTFSGIRPADVPGFIAAQLVGAALATALFRWLLPVAGDPGLEVPGRRSAVADLVDQEAP